MSNLHPYFEEIIQEAIKNALPIQIERERNKPRIYNQDLYIEYHESRDELEMEPEMGWR